MMSIFLLTIAPATCVGVFLSPEAPSAPIGSNRGAQQDILDELELTIGIDSRRNIEARFDRLSDILHPMFQAAPKNTHGTMSAPTARYTLDRLFTQLHGWHVKGLRPVGEAWVGTSPTLALTNLAPSREVQYIFDARFEDNGLTLRELTVLAALLEDLLYSEVVVRLRLVYQAMDFPLKGVLAKSQVSTAIDTFMASFILGLNVTDLDPQVFKTYCSAIAESYPTWRETQEFMRAVESEFNHIRKNFNGMRTVVEAISERYETWQRAECRTIKDRLVGLEDSSGKGHVALRHFYGSSIGDGQWFTESVQFLRVLGALDESNPADMSVFIPNYVSSPTNCIASSNAYSVCCPDECEGIMALLEGKLGEPTAIPADIVTLVEDYLLAVGNETMPLALVDRLRDVAEYHGGRVPLHGRLFAQWLHHVFPRDCPYPHISGTTRPQLIADWEDESGESGMASQEEIGQHLSSGRGSYSTGQCEASWSMVEELLEQEGHHTTVAGASVPSGNSSGVPLLDAVLLALASGAVVVVVAAALAGVVAPLCLRQTRPSPDTVYSL